MTESSLQVPDFSLSPELQAFRDRVHAFAEEHLGDARRYDAEVEFPRRLNRTAAGQAGQ